MTTITSLTLPGDVITAGQEGKGPGGWPGARRITYQGYTEAAIAEYITDPHFFRSNLMRSSVVYGHAWLLTL